MYSKKITLVAFNVALFASIAFAQKTPFVELKNKQIIEGSALRVDSKGTYILKVDGSGNREFAPNQITRAVGVKPANLAGLKSAVAAGNFEASIASLKQIVSANIPYWSGVAAGLLAEAQLGTDDVKGALKTFDSIFKKDPKAAEGSGRFGYWKALLANDKIEELEPMLEKEILSGDREGAANAQLIRGDLSVKRNKLAAALSDYLRTATLYKKQKDLQPEALYKTATTMDALKDKRAKNYWKMLAEKHASTSYGQEAAGKI